ncbi:fimbrial protein [Citrobacter freundii]|uniref:fimbrial protein n=1 Tax=Citrobacter freundii TaxID=546 RepID=UPI0015E90F3A|nr:fimbrial protein [Citrobacter freundii]QLR78161.1 fimbrial protein [Citrobacter freundii]
MTRGWLRLAMVGGALVFSGMAGELLAANKTVNMKLTVVINAPPPCTVTGGTVEFGDVLTTKVDGVNFLQPVGYSLSCNGRLSDFLKLQIQGTAITINGESVLKTNVPNLGIRLQNVADKSVIPPGSVAWLPFQYTGGSGPAIQAVPVKTNGVTLTGGAFNAGATLVVDYQ